MLNSPEELARLSPAQRSALRHVEESISGHGTASSRRVIELLERAGCTIDAYKQAMRSLKENARVVIHFHPDRIGPKRMTVAQALLDDGLYRNQFQTRLSSGGLSAFPGGERDTWERTLFGGAYHESGAAYSERPKYGALELVRYADGPIPRFGSCYFVLRTRVSCRISFTFMGSEDPRASQRLGIIDRMDGVLSALFGEIVEGGIATPPWPPFRVPTLGVPKLTVPRLLDLLCDLQEPRSDPALGRPGRVLDTGIEAQVHGPVSMKEDIELLVADPAFAGTATGATLRQLATKYRFPLKWHCGFQLAVHDVPNDFRGPEMPRLARRIAGSDGMLNAAVIGAAEASLREHPECWEDWGSLAESIQHLKQLWHVLVNFGSPYSR
jgi:Protein of unknown function (DUF3626)